MTSPAWNFGEMAWVSVIDLPEQYEVVDDRDHGWYALYAAWVNGTLDFKETNMHRSEADALRAFIAEAEAKIEQANGRIAALEAEGEKA